MCGRDDEDLDEPGPLRLGTDVKNAWRRRKEKLEHDYAITGWTLSISPEVRTDINERLGGKHRNAIECLVLRLHLVPCPNDDATEMTSA